MQRMLRKTTAICTLLTLTASAAALAAANTSTNKATVGTTQLQGDQARIGTTYTLGKKLPINITLDSVEYTVERLPLGTDVIAPKRGEKLLVLHYTLHNPNKQDFGIVWHTLKFTAVDANDRNWDYCANVGIEKTFEKASMSLKPAQKTKLYTAILVPAKGQIPKLIIESKDHLVLRYDLRGKAKPLPAPIADSADPSGATAYEEVPGQLNAFYPSLMYDIKLDSVSFTKEPISGKAPKNGNRYLVFIATARNKSLRKDMFVWSRFNSKLVDQDGAPFKWNGSCLFPSRDDSVKADVDPGKEVRFRQYYEVPEKLGMQSLHLTEGSSGRTYVFDVSKVQ